MEKQVLSIEQMRHLQELGVDTSKASMCWIRELNSGEYHAVPHDEFCYEMSCLNPIPTYTLQNLIDIIPTIIRSEWYESFSLRIRGYRNDWEMYYDTLGDSVSSKLFSPIEGDTLLEAAYNMLCYLAENNLLGKEENR